MINLPENVISAINLLENSGFEAYAVGGAVRDSLLGKNASDFDITTSAFPEETKKVFSAFKVIETGIKHGTVTVLFDGEPLEITTFRIDGEYEDNRHPESVVFTRNIKDDLSRRDFTVNAIAYSHKRGLVDFFGGLNDLKKGIIRAVGEADKRFGEDALRILRCVRFASTLGFEIEEETSKSVRKNIHLLDNVSAERIFVELKKMICGKNVGDVFEKYPDVISKIVPELEKSVGFDQKSKYHIFDVYTHTYKSISISENNVILRLALLFHDCGKPYVYTTDEEGFRHFIGHQKESVRLTENALLRLKCDNKTLEMVKTLVLYHDYKLERGKKYIKRFLTKVSFDEARLIIKMKYADMASHAPKCIMSEEERDEFLFWIDELEREGTCVSLKTLAVKGEDLFSIGIPKERIMGRVLNNLLELVVEEKIPNERNELLKKGKELFELLKNS
ncbi:MAG: CCA tRNA nucleotidyltransferase [Clostridia bacterium]|nr:CCA tRNA nucleotidyltransferase [Clostridia bacterium]